MDSRKYIALGAAIVLLAGGAYVSERWFAENYTQEMRATLGFTATTTSSVLDAMNALAGEDKLSFSGREYAGLGFFVEEINGKKNGHGYYWILSINGKKSELGVSSALVRGGDQITWSYEKGY